MADNEDSPGAIGRPLDRVDGRDKVLGRTRFTADRMLPRLAYAVLVQAVVAHAHLIRESLADAVKGVGSLPGVLYILTPENCPKLRDLPGELTEDLPAERRPPLSDHSIEYAGQHVALVVAETLEEATFAADRLRRLLAYEELPRAFSAVGLLAEQPSSLAEYGRVRRGTYLPDHFTKLKAEKLQYARGKADPEREAVRVAETYATPVEHHHPIELSSTIARWDGGSVTVFDSTRWIMGSRKTIASYLDLPEDHVRIVCPFVGGAFGSKGFLWQHVVLAAIAAYMVERPVKLVVSRRQMFTSVGHRPATLQQLSLAADSEGRLTTIEHHTLSETSTVGQFTEPAGLTSRNLYRCPHVVTSHRVARLNKPTPCFMRAPGEAPGVFALECGMDELAVAMDLDPLELRLRNYADRDEDGDKPWSGKHLGECYAEAAERFGWKARSRAARSMQRGGKQVGWGMATATYPARRMAAGCRAKMTREGCAQFFSATHEIGTGVRTVMTQIAADWLEIPDDRVRFYSGDSRYPAAPYTGASQTSATVGSAVREAALLLRGRLVTLAVEDRGGPLYGLTPQSVELTKGWLMHRERPERCEFYLDLLARASAETIERSLLLEVQAEPPDLERYGFQSFGAHLCEVEVDESTGMVKVVRWCGVFDGGTILNPKLARSQIIGGVTFGIGMALLEETHYDSWTTLAINTDLGEYHLPTAADVPNFDVKFVEHPDDRLNALGMRGIGELGIVGAAAAIANAIYHATGRRLRELPITCDQLM